MKDTRYNGTGSFCGNLVLCGEMLTSEAFEKLIMKEMYCIRHLAVNLVLQHMLCLPDAATIIASV
jgi:hypothetical protein